MHSPTPLPSARPLPHQEQIQVIQSKDLLDGRSAVAIEHNGQRYCLQTTRAGKLILTK
jgi:hemin uptake protein HemP